ncbi:MAG: hypothetical protein ACSLEN_02380 [Candidatus Malihini olakiniferum]
MLGVLQWGVVLKNRLLMADRKIDFSSVNARKAYLIGALAVGNSLSRIHYVGSDFHSLHYGADERKACLVCWR